MDAQNWLIISSDLGDARKELENLEAQISSGNFPDEIEFPIALQHTFYHLNFAWKTRSLSPEEYAHMPSGDFERFGKFPNGLFFE